MTTGQKVGLNDDDYGHLFNLPDDSKPGYASFWGAFFHVYLLALGEFNNDDYELGESNF
jgi:hypothetical protein